MKYISILVSKRHATYISSDPPPVCANSDYMIRFTFDEEWDEYEHKTARFVSDKGYIDVLFDNAECQMPPLYGVRWVEVGVYAGDLRTTSAAYIPLSRSILCGDNPVHPDPPEDIYNQLLERLNALEEATISPEAIERAVADYLEENPIEGGVDFTTDETLSLSDDKILSVNRAFSVEQDNTLPITSAAVHATVGNINALLETI